MDDALKLVNRHTGETLRLRRVASEHGQLVLTIEGTLPAGSQGPPPHIHFHQVEEGTIIAGTLGAKVDGKIITIPAGQDASFPAGSVHSWWNAGDVLLEFSGRAIPAGDLDQFLQGVFAVLNASPTGRPSLFYLAHVLWRHRHSQVIVTPPLAIQRLLFPLVIAVGQLLGKYRGTEWPGSPESCPGAP
jgi:quercetin dioxygenase-like cupin family protein